MSGELGIAGALVGFVLAGCTRSRVRRRAHSAIAVVADSSPSADAAVYDSPPSAAVVYDSSFSLKDLKDECNRRELNTSFFIEKEDFIKALANTDRCLAILPVETPPGPQQQEEAEESSVCSQLAETAPEEAEGGAEESPDSFPVDKAPQENWLLGFIFGGRRKRKEDAMQAKVLNAASPQLLAKCAEEEEAREVMGAEPALTTQSAKYWSSTEPADAKQPQNASELFASFMAARERAFENKAGEASELRELSSSSTSEHKGKKKKKKKNSRSDYVELEPTFSY